MGEDTNSRITPEKQLLKLIEDSEGDHLGKAKEKYQTRSFFSLDSIKALWPFSGGMNAGRAFSLDIRGVNWILKICAFGAAAYVTIYITMSMNEMKMTPQLVDIGMITASRAVKIREVQSGINPQAFYTDKVDARNIFAPYAEKVEEPTEEIIIAEDQPKAVTTGAAEFLSGLRLVGIAGTKEPDIIIENTRISRTFFLRKGDRFGDAIVQEVYPDRVIILYEDQELELR